MASYYAFSIDEDQQDSASFGYFIIRKSRENFRIWSRLKDDDHIIVAPISVPFKLYSGTVRSIGVTDNFHNPSETQNGLIVYVSNVQKGEDITTDLYNLKLFSKARQLLGDDAGKLRQLCTIPIRIEKRVRPKDCFPVKLFPGFELKPAYSHDASKAIKRMSSTHPFGYRKNGLDLILLQGRNIIGGCTVSLGHNQEYGGRLEKLVFGNSYKYLADSSVYIDRTFSSSGGPSKHSTYYMLYIAIFRFSRSLFENETSYVCGYSYDFLPAAARAGARIELPDGPLSALFYWRCFEPNNEPLTRAEYGRLKSDFRELVEHRNSSNCWFGVADRPTLEESLKQKMWLISDRPKQRAKWAAVRPDDRLFLADRQGNLWFAARVAKTSRKTIRQYENYPLAIEFSNTHKFTINEQVFFVDEGQWLVQNHKGGMSSIPKELSLHLTNEMAIRNREETMYVEPNQLLIPGTDFKVKQKHVFVVQAWSLKDSVLPVLRTICEGAGYTVTHSEDRQGMVVFRDIWKLLNEAEVVVVDFSGQRPNVFLEFGMTLVLGKPFVAITQSKDDIPSDTPNLKWNLYTENTSLKDLRDLIPRAIDDALQDVAESKVSRRDGVF